MFPYVLHPAQAHDKEKNYSKCPTRRVHVGRRVNLNIMMRKLCLFVFAMCMAVAANAQKGEMSLGGNLSFGIDDGYNNFGIGPKFQYTFAEKWRGEASFDYFLKKDHMSEWDINLNVHYIVPIKESKFNFYPLAGLTVLGWNVENGGPSDSGVGFNLGGGFEYYISEHFKANLEGKFQWTDDIDRGVIAIGAAYVF